MQSAQEFLSSSRFGPWVTRIELHTLQEQRGDAEQRGIPNTSLAPERHVIDRIFRSYGRLSRPRGDARIIKEAYFDFCDPMGIFRINMSGPASWWPAYSSPFNGVLTLTERDYPLIAREHVLFGYVLMSRLETALRLIIPMGCLQCSV